MAKCNWICLSKYFCLEGTIAENVAFGIPEGEINVEQVLQAL